MHSLVLVCGLRLRARAALLVAARRPLAAAAVDGGRRRLAGDAVGGGRSRSARSRSSPALAIPLVLRASSLRTLVAGAAIAALVRRRGGFGVVGHDARPRCRRSTGRAGTCAGLRRRRALCGSSGTRTTRGSRSRRRRPSSSASRDPTSPNYWRTTTLDQFQTTTGVEDLFWLDQVDDEKRALQLPQLVPARAAKPRDWLEQTVQVEALVDDHLAAAGTPVGLDASRFGTVFQLSGGVLRVREPDAGRSALQGVELRAGPVSACARSGACPDTRPPPAVSSRSTDVSSLASRPQQRERAMQAFLRDPSYRRPRLAPHSVRGRAPRGRHCDDAVRSRAGARVVVPVRREGSATTSRLPDVRPAARGLRDANEGRVLPALRRRDGAHAPNARESPPASPWGSRAAPVTATPGSSPTTTPTRGSRCGLPGRGGSRSTRRRGAGRSAASTRSPPARRRCRSAATRRVAQDGPGADAGCRTRATLERRRTPADGTVARAASVSYSLRHGCSWSARKGRRATPSLPVARPEAGRDREPARSSRNSSATRESRSPERDAGDGAARGATTSSGSTHDFRDCCGACAFRPARLGSAGGPARGVRPGASSAPPGASSPSGRVSVASCPCGRCGLPEARERDVRPLPARPEPSARRPPRAGHGLAREGEARGADVTLHPRGPRHRVLPHRALGGGRGRVSRSRRAGALRRVRALRPRTRARQSGRAARRRFLTSSSAVRFGRVHRPTISTRRCGRSSSVSERRR